MPTPTEEQLAALDLFAQGTDLAIEAGAGTGKTTTLLMIGNSTSRQGQYVAFNKAIVAEAQRKVPDRVGCATAHSLAMRSVGWHYRDRLGSSRIKSNEVADILDLRGMTITAATGNRKFLRPGYLASLVMRSVGAFCNSADAEIGLQHVPYIEGIDPLDQGQRTYANNKAVRQHIESALKKAWADLIRTDGVLRFTHDHYLKIWQLSGPVIGADYILFDEAQDASPVMLDIVNQQRHAQRVYVGDSCQPPGTMVTVVRQGSGRVRGASQTELVPIEHLRIGDKVVTYDMRSGYLHRNGRPISGITERPYAGELITIECDGRRSRYTPNHFCVVRIGEALLDKHIVYVMRRGNDYRIGRTQGQHAKQGDRLGISIRGRQEGADAIWIIGIHDTAQAAAEHEQTAAWQYGLPTLTFRWSKGVLSQEALNRFWAANGNNEDWAKACLLAHDRDIAWPLWEFANGNLLRRRPLKIRAINLIDGMLALPDSTDMLFHRKAFDRSFWRPIRISREEYSGSVWSLNIEDHHTYIADGLLTSNCQQVYEWRGAVNALASLPDARKTYLSRSFRFGPPIADAANLVLMVLDAELRLKGEAPHDSRLGPLDKPQTYLYRTNAAALGRVLELLQSGRRPHLVGGGTDILNFARAVEELQTRGFTSHPELACFSSWGEVLGYVAEDEQGSELKVLVDLISRFGIPAIRRVLETMADESAADVIVSTAHKSKGREWDTVRLGDDYPDLSSEDSDWRLLYVAITRARKVLDYFDCDPVAFLVPPPERQVS